MSQLSAFFSFQHESAFYTTTLLRKDLNKNSYSKVKVILAISNSIKTFATKFNLTEANNTITHLMKTNFNPAYSLSLSTKIYVLILTRLKTAQVELEFNTSLP